MPADKLVLEAQLVEAALQAQIENLRGIKAKLTHILDKPASALDDYERERLQALINLACGIEAFIDRPENTARECKKRVRRKGDLQE